MYQRVAILTLAGKLMGPPASNQLVEKIKNLINEGVFRIIIDLSHVNWINSLGVGSIMKCYSVVQQANGKLHLVGLTEKVRSVFVITQLMQVFTIHDDVESAVTLLNQT